MSKFWYSVQGRRRVQCWSGAWLNDRVEKIFPFGKGQEYPTGARALIAAREYATTILDSSSEVVIWRMSTYKGEGETIKNTPEMFNTRYDGTVPSVAALLGWTP